MEVRKKVTPQRGDHADAGSEKSEVRHHVDEQSALGSAPDCNDLLELIHDQKEPTLDSLAEKSGAERRISLQRQT
jgi:hypothetical protein